jgi:phytoene synthase
LADRLKQGPSEACRAACRQAIITGSRSFHAASLLLPKRVREPAYALYAFCRLADDAVDLSNGKPEALARLRARLDAPMPGGPMTTPPTAASPRWSNASACPARCPRR